MRRSVLSQLCSSCERGLTDGDVESDVKRVGGRDPQRLRRRPNLHFRFETRDFRSQADSRGARCAHCCVAGPWVENCHFNPQTLCSAHSSLFRCVCMCFNIFSCITLLLSQCTTWADALSCATEQALCVNLDNALEQLSSFLGDFELFLTFPLPIAVAWRRRFPGSVLVWKMHRTESSVSSKNGTIGVWCQWSNTKLTARRTFLWCRSRFGTLRRAKQGRRDNECIVHENKDVHKLGSDSCDKIPVQEQQADSLKCAILVSQKYMKGKGHCKQTFSEGILMRNTSKMCAPIFTIFVPVCLRISICRQVPQKSDLPFWK